MEKQQDILTASLEPRTALYRVASAIALQRPSPAVFPTTLVFASLFQRARRLPISPTFIHTHPVALVYEVHAEKMQHQAPHDEIRKRPLLADAFELARVLRIRLDAQARREHELADCDAEAGEEGVERLYTH